MEYLRTIAHLRPRTNTFNAVFRVRSVAAFALHKFFNERGFVYAHTPIITGSDCEGAGEMFHITTLDAENPPRTEDGQVDYSKDFFGKKTSLTVSGQLDAECMAMAFGKVYTFGPTFRAENSNTPRHAAEFWMIEPEIAFADLNDDMELAEDMMKYVIRYVLDSCPDEMAFFNNFYDKGLIERLEGVVDADFARCTYTEAIELLEKAQRPVRVPGLLGLRPADRARAVPDREDLSKAGLCHRLSQGDQGLLYAPQRRRQDGGGLDLLVPGIGEIIGGSQREERLDVLTARMARTGPGGRGLRVVPGPAPLWRHQARRVRPGF